MRISDDFIKEKVEHECVLVPIGEKYQNGIFTLNETAERIFDLLHDGKNRDEILAVLCREYDSDEAEIISVTDEFIAKLRDAGIVIDD